MHSIIWVIIVIDIRWIKNDEISIFQALKAGDGTKSWNQKQRNNQWNSTKHMSCFPSKRATAAFLLELEKNPSDLCFPIISVYFESFFCCSCDEMRFTFQSIPNPFLRLSNNVVSFGGSYHQLNDKRNQYFNEIQYSASKFIHNFIITTLLISCRSSCMTRTQTETSESRSDVDWCLDCLIKS